MFFSKSITLVSKIKTAYDPIQLTFIVGIAVETTETEIEKPRYHQAKRRKIPHEMQR